MPTQVSQCSQYEPNSLSSAGIKVDNKAAAAYRAGLPNVCNIAGTLRISIDAKTEISFPQPCHAPI